MGISARQGEGLSTQDCLLSGMFSMTEKSRICVACIVSRVVFLSVVR